MCDTTSTKRRKRGVREQRVDAIETGHTRNRDHGSPWPGQQARTPVPEVEDEVPRVNVGGEPDEALPPERHELARVEPDEETAVGQQRLGPAARGPAAIQPQAQPGSDEPATDLARLENHAGRHRVQPGARPAGELEREVARVGI